MFSKGFPSLRIDPELSFRLPERILKRVVFPTPFLPKTPFISFELKERFQGNVDYKNQILNELKAIVKLNPAKNYINLKIRQRYWVMNFMNSFSNKLNKIKELVDVELLIKT